jgi:hypothetical protein
LLIEGVDQPIYKEKTTIGRDPLADINLNLPVSSYYFKFEFVLINMSSFQIISKLHATIKVNLIKSSVFVCVYGKGNFFDGVRYIFLHFNLINFAF